jgi:cysteinyl-tRNA synthetase
MSRKKEKFVPLRKKEVRMYTCGPTVYDYPHIGNLRAFMFYDVLRRYLKYKGFEVKHVMNITDVDDKTIRNSKAQGMSLRKFTEKYTKAFFEDLRTLNIETPEFTPKATECIEDMVKLVKILMKKGYAYRGDDGSIYYDVSKFEGYGKLSKIDVSKLKPGVRVRQDEYTKDEVQDFALWKAWTKKDGNVFWETEIGRGRPGWHIECSAMGMKYLGVPIDIHGGGVDLIFPHHENEIAQSEGATGKTFVRYWLHNEHVLVDGKKMSKSLGNFFTLRDLLSKGHDPMSIRFALLSTHYRSQLNITDKSLWDAKQSLDRIRNFIDLLKEVKGGRDNKKVDELIKKTKKEFEGHMDDDLDMNLALASVFDFIKEMNKLLGKKKVSEKNAQSCLKLMRKFDQVLGVLGESEEITPEFIGKIFAFIVELRKDLDKRDPNLGKKLDLSLRKVKDLEHNLVLLNKLIEIISEIREDLRKRKKYDLSDYIRAKLREFGIVIEDKEKGVRWRKV